MANDKGQSKLTYPYDSKPPFLLSTVLGAQHLLVYIGGLIVFPVVVGGAFGLDVVQKSVFLGSTWFGMGVATFLQAFLIGNKYPVVQGPSFSFILPALSVAALTGGGVEGMAIYTGGVILGGITEAVIGYGKLVGLVRKAISPISMGVVVMLIGLGLYKLKIKQASGNWLIAVIVFSLLTLFSIVLGPKRPKIKAASVIIGLSAGYLICLIGSLAGIIPEGSTIYVNFQPVLDASWINLPKPFPWGFPKFNIPAFIILMAGFISSIVESIGDYHAIAHACELPDPTEKQLGMGIGAEGVGCVISGIFGGPATTSYTENIGTIVVTGVASRHVVGFCAGLTIVLGLFRKFGTLLATIPGPVTGGVMMLTSALIAGSGLQLLTRTNLNSVRNLAVISVSLFLGIGLPHYIDTTPIAIAGMDTLSSILNGLLGTPMAAGLIVSLILDNVLPGTPEDRGITAKDKG